MIFQKYIKSFLILLLTISTTLTFPCASQIDNPEVSDTELSAKIAVELDQKISDLLKGKDIPGFALAVVNDEKIIWETVRGVTARSSNTRITSETLFSIQSITKSFTATAVMMAVQEGLLDLDKPIAGYLPGFKLNSRNVNQPVRLITLRHLLSHHAGLTHHAPVGNYFDNTSRSFEDHINSISKTWLRYPPGYRFAYSNLGFDLAGYILQKVSEISYEKYIAKKLFNPLGMRRSTFDVSVLSNDKTSAQGTIAGKTDLSPDVPAYIPMIPAGGLITNLEDMAKFCIFHINAGVIDDKRLLSSGLIDEQHSLNFAHPEQRSGFGLGFFLEQLNDKHYKIFHTGGGYGFRAAIYLYPTLETGIIVLTNSVGHSLHSKLENLADAIVKKNIVAPGLPAISMQYASVKPIQKKDIDFDRFLGTYEYGIKMVHRNGTLGIINQGSVSPIKLYQNDQDIFGVYRENNFIHFLDSINGNPGSLKIIAGPKSSPFYLDYVENESSAEANTYRGSKWKKFIGTFEAFTWVPEDKAIWEITLDNRHLKIDGKKCYEHEPDLFFDVNGEVLDFRDNSVKYKNIILKEVSARRK